MTPLWRDQWASERIGQKLHCAIDRGKYCIPMRGDEACRACYRAYRNDHGADLDLPVEPGADLYAGDGV